MSASGALIPFARRHAFQVARDQGLDPDHARTVAYHYAGLAARGRALTGWDLNRRRAVYCFGVVPEGGGVGGLWSHHAPRPFEGHSGLWVLRLGRRVLERWQRELGLTRLVARLDPGAGRAERLYMRGLGFVPEPGRPGTYLRLKGGV